MPAESVREDCTYVLIITASRFEDSKPLEVGKGLQNR